MRRPRWPVSVRAETGLALAVSLAVAVVMTWPTMAAPGSTVPADLGDPLLEVWTMAWDGHALLHQLGHPFDANTFYPLRDSLGFSDSLFGYVPLALLGSGTSAALVHYNVAYVLAYAVCGWGAYLLARQLAARPAGAAVAGAAFAYAPWRADQAGHLQILSCGAVPLALALLARGHGYRLGRARPATLEVRPRPAVTGWLVAAWQLSLGFGVGLQWGYLVAGLVVVTSLWWAGRGRPPLPRRLWLADAVGGIVFALTAAVFALPYLVAVHDHPEARRTLAELQFFSPPLRGFLIVPGTNRLWGAVQAGPRAALGYAPEATLALGASILVLASLGAVVGRWSRRRRLLLAAAAVVLLVFALGTNGPFGGRFTYLVLFHHAPGFAGIRTPGRLVVLASLALALLAAQGADAVVDAVRGSGAARWAPLTGVALSALVLLEGVTDLPHPRPQPAPTAALQAGGPGPLLVLPSGDLPDDTTMFWTIGAFEPVVNGSSGFTPALTAELRADAADLPATGADALRRAGVTRVAVLLADYGQADRAQFLGNLPGGVSRVVVDGVAVFSLGGKPIARHG